MCGKSSSNMMADKRGWHSRILIARITNNFSVLPSSAAFARPLSILLFSLLISFSVSEISLLHMKTFTWAFNRASRVALWSPRIASNRSFAERKTAISWSLFGCKKRWNTRKTLIHVVTMLLLILFEPPYVWNVDQHWRWNCAVQRNSEVFIRGPQW